MACSLHLPSGTLECRRCGDRDNVLFLPEKEVPDVGLGRIVLLSSTATERPRLVPVKVLPLAMRGGVPAEGDDTHAVAFLTEAAWRSLEVDSGGTVVAAEASSTKSRLPRVSFLRVAAPEKFVSLYSTSEAFIAWMLAGEVACAGSILDLPWFPGHVQLNIVEVHLDNDQEEDRASAFIAASAGIVMSNTRVDLITLEGATLSHVTSPLSGASPHEFRKAWIERACHAIGGVQEHVEAIVWAFSRCLFANTTAGESGEAPRAVLIHGDSGTGKTLLARTIAECSGFRVVFVSCPDMFERDEGSSERKLRRLFASAHERSPCILVLDEIDVLLPVMEHANPVEGRVAQLTLNLLDEIETGSTALFVFGTTTAAADVDVSARRHGRLGTLVHLLTPSPSQRRDMLRVMCGDIPLVDKDAVLNVVSQRSHGFSPADLSNLCREAVSACITRTIGTSPPDACLEMHDFETAFTRVSPSGLAEYGAEVPTEKFDDLIGVADVVLLLQAGVVDPLRGQGRFRSLGVSPPRGVLLYGLPGTGKSHIARALAAAVPVNLVHVQATELISKVVGDSEKALARLFSHARACAPCVLFLDQIDCIAPSAAREGGSSGNMGDRLLSCLLVELDGVSNSSADIVVVGATTRPEILDSAVIRAGRLDLHVHMRAPSEADRRALFLRKMEHVPTSMTSGTLHALADRVAVQTADFSGADIAGLCRDAAMVALRRDMEALVTPEDVALALRNSSGSLAGLKEAHPHGHRSKT